MIRKRISLCILAAIVFSIPAASQMTSWLQWTFLPQNQMDEIIGEASGEAAFKDRKSVV